MKITSKRPVADEEELIPFELPLPSFIDNNDPLPDPDRLYFYKELKERKIYLDFDVDQTLLDLERYIIQFNQEDKGIPIEERKPIKLFIYSYGGEVNPTRSLIDIILLSKTPIYTYNLGVAMSAGLYILLAGHKRYSLPSAQFLLHSGSGGTGGTYEQNKAQMENYDEIMKQMRKFILDRTSLPDAVYKKKSSKEWYISIDDAIKYHFIDGIITDIEELL